MHTYYLCAQVQSLDLVSLPALTASMLDPRHKHVGFLNSEKRLLANAKLLELAAAVPFVDVANTTDEPETRYGQQR